MPTIATSAGTKVRCTAHKTFAVVVETQAHPYFTGRYENGQPVWEDRPAKAVVVFRSNSSEAVTRRTNLERRRASAEIGPLRRVGVWYLPANKWAVAI